MTCQHLCGLRRPKPVRVGVAMHRRGTSADMMSRAHYDDVVAEVRDFLLDRAEQAAGAGVAELWVDPGIGFAKTAAQNLAILAHLDQFVATGWPVAVGLSRKRFTGAVAGGDDIRRRQPRTGWRPPWPVPCGPCTVVWPWSASMTSRRRPTRRSSSASGSGAGHEGKMGGRH